MIQLIKINVLVGNGNENVRLDCSQWIREPALDESPSALLPLFVDATRHTCVFTALHVVDLDVSRAPRRSGRQLGRGTWGTAIYSEVNGLCASAPDPIGPRCTAFDSCLHGLAWAEGLAPALLCLRPSSSLHWGRRSWLLVPGSAAFGLVSPASGGREAQQRRTHDASRSL